MASYIGAITTARPRLFASILANAPQPNPRVIGVDEISVKKGHDYRIVVSGLERRHPIWFGGTDRTEESMDLFYKELGPEKSKRIMLAVMDMWKAFRKSAFFRGESIRREKIRKKIFLG